MVGKANKLESPELAEDDGHDEEDKHSDDGDGDYPVGSHPIKTKKKVSCELLRLFSLQTSFKQREQTYGPCPSASSRSYRHNPRSGRERPGYAG